MSRIPAALAALSTAGALALGTVGPAAAQADDVLRIAVLNDDPAAIERAIRAGADPRVAGPDGSLLAQAALMGRARAVRALLAAGADPAAPGPNGETALGSAFFAISGAALLGRGEEPDPIRRAQALEVVRALAARRVGLDEAIRVGPTRMTPLMLAAQAGALDVAEILLEAGANPNAANGGGYTALDYAVDRRPTWATLPDRRVQIVRLLLVKGARRDRAGADRLTPLARARATGDAAIVSALEAADR